MNNFYTLHSLVQELKYKIIGKDILKVSTFQKDQIDLLIHSEKFGKLTFYSASPDTALFFDSHTGKTVKQNVATFFHEIWGNTIAGLELLSKNDRIIRLWFKEDQYELLFLPFGSRPNLFLVTASEIVSSFKDPSKWKGQPAPMPIIAGEQARLNNNIKQLAAKLETETTTRKKIIALDKQFPRGLIPDIIDTCELDGCDNVTLVRKITELQNILMNPEYVAITKDRSICLLRKSYLSYPPIQEFDSVNDAVCHLFIKINRDKRLLPRKNELIKKIEKKIVKLTQQKKQVNRNSERLQEADTYEHYGHLLMSQPDVNKITDSDFVSVTDWNNESRLTRIPATKGATILEQAKRYYNKATGMRQNILMTGENKSRLNKQLKELNKILEELREISHPVDLEKWLKHQSDIFDQLGILLPEKSPKARPFRLYKLGNYDVWIGKNARSNDELLKLSHKEDIWMHVRGAAGSHLILRNSGNTGWPDRTVILHAASWAAATSKLAGSSLVPVMIAKRKHVRKPKGAMPGVVKVIHEQVEMVTPHNPKSTNM
ncbi:MAG: NFACT RNA binding domain-containing protein [Balneolales bacterium]